jgi:hypothetical protein
MTASGGMGGKRDSVCMERRRASLTRQARQSQMMKTLKITIKISSSMSFVQERMG